MALHVMGKRGQANRERRVPLEPERPVTRASKVLGIGVRPDPCFGRALEAVLVAHRAVDWAISVLVAVEQSLLPSLSPYAGGRIERQAAIERGLGL
jgi:hypothetical protein